ncbi:MAG: hypothetical protein H6806_04325 [Planctomycetes bacterium]|nr:hypothetical protein [Planctomycetota bacterium]MCB9901835.1 hypothetical protein [Planctomycetota bacterium]
MKRAMGLSTAPLGERPASEAVLAWLDAWRPDVVVVGHGADRPTRLGEGLRARGSRLLGWAVPGTSEAPDEGRLEAAADEASRARASWVAVRGGRRPREGEDSAPAVDRLARRLYGPLRRGVPLAVLTGGAGDLLGADELGWLLDDLPALGVVFDVAAAVERARDVGGPEAPDALASVLTRVAWLRVAGRTSSGREGAHPEEGGLPWGTFSDRAPRGLPWVLDLAPGTPSDEVDDAWRWLGSF